MLKLAIASSPHRSVPSRDLLAIARATGVEGMAWCASFAPPGDPRIAEALMLETLRASLSTVAYETGLSAAALLGEPMLASVLATVSALHAPIVTCALPFGGSRGGRRAPLVEALRRAGDAAGKLGVVIAFDIERGSGLSGYEEALSLLKETAHPFVRLRWEPATGFGFDELMEGLDALSGYIPQVAARSAGEILESRDEDWQMWLDCFERQAGLGNMSHYVVLYGEGPDGAAGLRADALYLKTTFARLARMRGKS